MVRTKRYDPNGLCKAIIDDQKPLKITSSFSRDTKALSHDSNDYHDHADKRQGRCFCQLNSD